MTDLESIKKTLVTISKSDGILETLIEFERTLDNAEVFAYQHWNLGELVDGPHIDRYWYKTTWMYPFSKMPDPDGGLRLTKLGAAVSFKKSTLKKPVRVLGREDWANEYTKEAKIEEVPIWLVTIDLPIKYINNGMVRIDDIINADIDKQVRALEDEFVQEESFADPVEGIGDINPDEEIQ